MGKYYYNHCGCVPECAMVGDHPNMTCKCGCRGCEPDTIECVECHEGNHKKCINILEKYGQCECEEKAAHTLRLHNRQVMEKGHAQDELPF